MRGCRGHLKGLVAKEVNVSVAISLHKLEAVRLVPALQPALCLQFTVFYSAASGSLQSCFLTVCILENSLRYPL